MNSDIIRGHIDMIILSFLISEDLYGYKLSKLISAITNGEYNIKETSLYSSLRRLEESGMVVSYMVKDDLTNRKRRVYKISNKGKESYNKLCNEWVQTKKILDLFCKGDKNDN